MEQLIMSRTERTRLEVFARVKSKQIDKVKAAALLGLSYRQVLRSYARYAARGAAGLTHASRSRPITCCACWRRSAGNSLSMPSTSGFGLAAM